MDFNIANNMENCLFCKIVKGEIPSVKVFENENFLAFMDIYPVSKGHTLLIPKKHLPYMQDADDDTISKIFILARNLMRKIQKNLPCDYVQINVVGELVQHFHIHLMPRYLDDNFSKWPIISYDASDEIEIYANKIAGDK